MFKKAMIAGAVVLASVGANAATATLTVGGTITPEACAVTLGGNGLVNYGALSSGTVQAYSVYNGTNAVYIAPAKTVSLDVTCSAPTAFGLSWTDNRASSKLAVNSDDGIRFGLGQSGTNNIGAYQLNFSGLAVAASSTATPAAPAGILTRAAGTTGAWADASGISNSFFTPSLQMGFKTAASDTSPAALSKVTGNLSLVSHFNKAMVDSATTTITLDGLATLSLDYV